MATKDIKVGNFYHVLVKVLGIDPTRGEITTETVNEFGTSLNMEPTYFARCEKEAFFPIILENGRKNSATAPKYDPCRLFRDGDKVTPRLVNGRDFNSVAEDYRGKILTVTRDEEKYDNVFVECGGDEFTIDPAYLELVTPVEEQGPYSVRHNKAYAAWSIYGPFGLSSANYFYGGHYPYTSETANHAAEAECARLNAEYRKEVEK